MLDLDRHPTFAPRWASPPGETMRAALEERGMTIAEFALALGTTTTKAQALLSGQSRITLEMADRIHSTIGGSVSFWIARDGQYRDDLARVAADEWAQALPIRDMVKLGWIERPRTWQERVLESLRFFDVSALDGWTAKYGSLTERAHYRLAGAGQIDRNAVAVWLRQSERQSSLISTGDWDPTGFQEALAQARLLTTDRDPGSFVPALASLCAPHGVAVVLVRAPSGCPANGASRMLSSGSRLIALTGRHLTDDHLWYTFFHEAAHLLLHESDVTFVDQLDGNPDVPLAGEEEEADALAANLLLGPAAQDRLTDLPLRPWEIRRYARAQRIAPGIVVGQLQHLKRLPFGTKLNALKARYRWVGPNLERA